MIRVLVGESLGKTNQTVLTLKREELLAALAQDHEFHEVIPMVDPSLPLRVWFDIDCSSKSMSQEKVLEDVLLALNSLFHISQDQTLTAWSIVDGCRPGKISFHILSRYYSIALKDLRDLCKRVSHADPSAHWFVLSNRRDEGSLRLPNQSKGAIHKEGPPLTLLNGTLEECLVTNLDGLTLWTAKET